MDALKKNWPICVIFILAMVCTWLIATRSHGNMVNAVLQENYNLKVMKARTERFLDQLNMDRNTRINFRQLGLNVVIPDDTLSTGGPR